MMMLVGSAWGQYTGSGTFTKITSLGDLTDGYYVIVNSGDAFAMNNTNAGSFFGNTSVSPSSNTILNPSTSIVWKIEINSGGRTIYNEVTSKYVSYTGSSNAAYAVDAVTADAQRWDISYASNLFVFANLAISARILQYNASSPRFACYTSAQQKILLYKLEASSNDPEPTNHATGFSATTNSSSQITVNWTDAIAGVGEQLPSAYLVKASTGIPTEPVDGTAEADDILVKNISQGIQTAVFTGLDQSTTYNFTIWPYTNSGSNIDYKTNGTVPTANETTDEYIAPKLYISEVADPSDDYNGRFVELYNAGNSAIDFSTETWFLCIQVNGGTFTDIQLTGSVSSGSTFVTSYSAVNFLSIYGFSSNQNTGLNGSGNDGYFLYKDGNHLTGILVDSYGVINEDGAGMTWEYTDSKAVRKTTIIASNITWTASEWNIISSCNTNRMTPGMFPATAWNGGTNNNWTDLTNWDNGLNGSEISVLIPSGLTNYPTLTAASVCNNITIENGATLLGENNLTVNGTATVQKSITGYTGATDGWNVISAPVSGMAMAGSDFVPVTGEDDFYAYDQAENLWRNYLDGTNDPSWFDNFDAKTGYLVAYALANAGTKNFVGALNSDASYVAGLSNSNTSWNLIGNPYPSNITWAGVTLATASSPKVLNNSTGSWDDIGTILATGQGVFVYAEGGSSSVTFELADQTHTAPAKKAETVDQIKFIADFGGKSVSLTLVVNEAASQSYEWQYDARYLYPVTTIPYLCAITEDNVWVSKYSFGSQSLESTVIPLYFKVSEEQQITFGLESFTKEIGIKKITLEDKVANKLTDLSDGNVYLYTANPNDQTDRFVLHVETVTSIDETTHLESVQIYSYGNRIYLHSELNAFGDVTIYNLLGQNVYHTPVDLSGLQSFNLNLNTGWYVVQVVTKQGVKSKKVFIN